MPTQFPTSNMSCNISPTDSVSQLTEQVSPGNKSTYMYTNNSCKMPEGLRHLMSNIWENFWGALWWQSANHTGIFSQFKAWRHSFEHTVTALESTQAWITPSMHAWFWECWHAGMVLNKHALFWACWRSSDYGCSDYAWIVLSMLAQF